MTTKVTFGEKLIHPDETRNVFVDFAKELEDTGDDLTGTPTASEMTTTDLTLANVAVGTATFTDADDYVWTASKYVTFTISGQQDDTDYLVKVSTTSDAGNAETLVRIAKFQCRDR